MKIFVAIIAFASFGLFAFTPAPVLKGKKLEVSTASAGINFGKLTFAKALKQAKSSGKLIFIDVYTSWCGPCKQMAKNTFKNEQVGELFNSKFINMKLDAELDQDGIKVAQDYKVTAYPTLLFINGEGKLVKRVVGYQTPEKLISVAEKL
ncbi:MAG: thioredoxin family protein [Fluviicola sp.]|jgi:thioredoxin 1